MRAIVVDPETGLHWREVPDVPVAPGKITIDVAAAGVNRADLAQAAGQYPPPPGASETLGLEVSGTVADVGAGVTGWAIGQPVCALLDGGGYAERVAVPAGQVLPIPDGVDLNDAAGLPEVACTVWSNVVMTAGLRSGQLVLFHGGASGIGTHGIQIARALGARVAVTAGSAEKLAACTELGAQIAINHRDEDFVERIHAATDGAGANVVLDVVGGAYLNRNVDALAADGRIVVIGFLGGAQGELNLAKLAAKRAGIIATTLRARPIDGAEGKAAIVAEVTARVWPMVADGRVRPVIGARLPIERATEAHRLLQSGEVTGKVLLTVR